MTDKCVPEESAALSKTKDAPGVRIDQIMDKASKALVERRYFECERLSVEALEMAHQLTDYERMARICLPLQEARRQKRDLAADSRNIFVFDDQLPRAGKLQPGCYLVRPPRVGLDGRLLRELADKKEVPVIIVTREPTTRTGLWPVVSLGPVTVRTRVEPPVVRASSAAARARKKKPVSEAVLSPSATAITPGAVEDVLPPVEWFLMANEVLGDACIASIDPARPAFARVEDLLLRLAAICDHEKLHQRLAEACIQAHRAGPLERKARAAILGEDDFESEDHGDEPDEDLDT